MKLRVILALTVVAHFISASAISMVTAEPLSKPKATVSAPRDSLQIIIDAPAGKRIELVHAKDALDWALHTEAEIQSVITVESITSLVKKTFEEGNPALRSLPRRSSTSKNADNESLVMMIFLVDGANVETVSTKIQHHADQYSNKYPNTVVSFLIPTVQSGLR